MEGEEEYLSVDKRAVTLCKDHKGIYDLKSGLCRWKEDLTDLRILNSREMLKPQKRGSAKPLNEYLLVELLNPFLNNPKAKRLGLEQGFSLLTLAEKNYEFSPARNNVSE